MFFIISSYVFPEVLLFIKEILSLNVYFQNEGGMKTLAFRRTLQCDVKYSIQKNFTQRIRRGMLHSILYKNIIMEYYYDNFAEVMCRSNQRGVCFTDYVSVIIGNISPDHVHVLISVPPHLPVSSIVQYMRRERSQKTARRIQGIPIPSMKEC